ncbi:MAG TPA: type IV pilus assembly protein PilM [Solirubrobacterales bacterium]|nr:type IV pilus assembly protein PilM [Solirubrobacterales bacterium]
MKSQLPDLKLPNLKGKSLTGSIGGSRSKALVGLEIAADSVAAAELRTPAGELGEVAVAPLAEGVVREGEVSDPEALASALRDLFAEHRLPRRVRLGIANQRVAVRTVRLPAIDDPSELEAAVRFQAQEVLPMPLDQAVLEHQVVGGAAATEGSPASIDVLVVAARREMIAAALHPLHEAGLEPVGIDLSAFGLIRALSESGVAPEEDGAPEGTDEVTLFCDLGDTTNLVIARKRSCLFARLSPVGLGGIASSLAAETGLTVEHARQWIDHVGLKADPETIGGDPGAVGATRQALATGADALQAELRLSIDFYAAQEGARPVSRIVLSGPGSAVPGLANAIGDGLSLPFDVAVPSALRGLDAATAARVTLPYGIALAA